MDTEGTADVIFLQGHNCKEGSRATLVEHHENTLLPS